VEADEIRVRCQKKVLWLAMALCVSSRLWLGAVVPKVETSFWHARSPRSSNPVVGLVRFWSLPTAGSPIHDAFCQSVSHAGIHRRTRPARVAVLAGLCAGADGSNGRKRDGRWASGSVICWATRATLPACCLRASLVSTAYIERLNATFRQRLAGLCRRTRCLLRSETTLSVAVYLVGCV